MRVEFVVYGTPRGKGRPRFYNGHATTDSKTRAYERRIAADARAAMGGHPPFDGPVRVRVRAVFEPAASLSKTKRAALIAASAPVTKKPDLDNIQKAALDGCNGIVFSDDARVASITASKVYGPLDCLQIVVEGIDG